MRPSEGPAARKSLHSGCVAIQDRRDAPPAPGGAQGCSRRPRPCPAGGCAQHALTGWSPRRDVGSANRPYRRTSGWLRTSQRKVRVAPSASLAARMAKWNRLRAAAVRLTRSPLPLAGSSQPMRSASAAPPVACIGQSIWPRGTKVAHIAAPMRAPHDGEHDDADPYSWRASCCSAERRSKPTKCAGGSLHRPVGAAAAAARPATIRMAKAPR